MYRRRLAAIRLALLALLLAAAGTGCTAPPLRCDGPMVLSSGEPVCFGDFEQLPRFRLGCLPFHGPFTLLSVADPDELGEHRYAGLFGNEVDRGVVYTRRAGFIDLAHVRLTVDLTAYFATRFEVALREGWSPIQMRSLEPSIYRIELAYPREWDELPPASREMLVRELSMRLGQRLAVKAMTWHEIITWFGYKTLVILPENESAFSFDDPPSHLVGALIAGEVLRAGDGDYDEAVTAALDRWLERLEVVSAQETERAIRDVHGLWWENGRVLRRMLAEGIDEPLVPWTLEPGEPEPLELPPLDEVMGRDCSAMATISIDPCIFQASRIRAALPGEPEHIDADVHMPLLIEHIRASWLAEEGPHADQPALPARLVAGSARGEDDS